MTCKEIIAYVWKIAIIPIDVQFLKNSVIIGVLLVPIRRGDSPVKQILQLTYKVVLSY